VLWRRLAEKGRQDCPDAPSFADASEAGPARGGQSPAVPAGPGEAEAQLLTRGNEAQQDVPQHEEGERP